MNRDIGILTLASTIRELVEAREESAARVVEIDAVLDDCRRALGVPPADRGHRPIALGNVVPPHKAGTADSGREQPHRRPNAGEGKATAAPASGPAPRPSTPAGVTCPDCGGRFVPRRAPGITVGRLPRYCDPCRGIAPPKPTRAARPESAGYEVVASGRMPGLSSAMGNSSLAGTAPDVRKALTGRG